MGSEAERITLKYDQLAVKPSQECIDALIAYVHAVNRVMQKAEPGYAHYWTGAVIYWKGESITNPQFLWMADYELPGPPEREENSINVVTPTDASIQAAPPLDRAVFPGEQT